MLLTSDTITFKEKFNNKLVQMLNKDELGSFILVLANSMQDPQLYKLLAPKLQTTFEAIKSNPDLFSSADDLCILNALKTHGISQYSAWETRNINHWHCALNPFRALRPERSSKDTFTSLNHPFNNDAFHFSKPFLRPEILSEERFENTNLQIMYQKFPFVPYHLLVVIQAEQKKAQYLDEKTHHLIWKLATHIEKNIEGFGLSYNSLGAGASVNQLHIHGFINDATLAIEQSHWTHNGGKEKYPLRIKRYNSVKESWEKIHQYHTHNQAYNLLYRAGVCYIIPRKPQGNVPTSKWLSSINWYEACGGFNLSVQNDFHDITSTNIHSTLAEYSI